MYLLNGGNIHFEKDVDDKLLEYISDKFGDIHVDVAKSVVYITEIYGDIEDELVDIQRFAKDKGNPMKDLQVDYYGDYDGGYRIVEGEINSYDTCDLGIVDKSAQILLEKVEEKPDAAYTYRVIVSGRSEMTAPITVCLAASEESAKKLTREWVGKVRPDEDEHLLFNLVKEKLGDFGYAEGNEVIRLDLESWLAE